MSRDCRQHGRNVVDSNRQAVDHYYQDYGSDVTLGAETQFQLRSNRRFHDAKDNLEAGNTAMSGSFGVDLTTSGVGFHVGRTNVDYSTTCGKSSCTTTFVGFVRDGFWDVTSNKDGDGIGPKNELNGGRPYRYKPYSWTHSYAKPEAWKSN
jgi:hypothetical protein